MIKKIKIDVKKLRGLYVPINIHCPKCNCFLARINAVKINDGYLCEECYNKGVKK